MAILGLVLMVILLLVAVFAEFIAPYGEDEQNYPMSLRYPCRDYPLGTDNYGRDILSRLIYGARVSLKVGFLSVFLSLIVGGTFGLIASYFGGRIDELIMRTMDILYAMPSFLMAIAVAAALGAGEFNLILAISVSQIPGYSRIVRAAALTVRETEYIEAARAVGASSTRIITRHILPNVNASLKMLSFDEISMYKNDGSR